MVTIFFEYLKLTNCSPSSPVTQRILSQQTHPLQTTDPPRTYLRRPRLEHYIFFYRHLQLLKSKRLRVIGNYPRRTPISHLHSALNLEPIQEFIYRLTDKFFYNCSTHPNPLLRQIGNYPLPDLHKQYRKYINKRTKNLLL